MNFKFLFFALPFLAMTACSSDDDVSENHGSQQQGKGVPISIEVSEEPLNDPSGVGTRASITFKESLSSFYMHYITTLPKTHTGVVAFSITDLDHTWINSGANWPADAEGFNELTTPVYFYAFANVDYVGHDFTGYNYNELDVNDSDNFDPNEQSLNFEIDELSSKQMDLLVAKQVSTMLSTQGQTVANTVSFSFQHACAALQFSICKTQALENINIILKKVVLHNVKKRGTYFFESGEWTVYNSEGTNNPYLDLTLAEYDDNSIKSVPYENAVESNHILLASNEDDFLFVIPQTLNGWTGTIEANNLKSDPEAYIEIQCKMWQGATRIDEHINQEEYGSIYLPFNVEWQKGFIYRYNIRMGTNLRYSDGSKISISNNS